MSYSIAKASDPQYSPTSSPESISDWVFNQPDVVTRTHIPGDAFPAAVSIDFSVPDVITQFQDDNTYDHFLVEWDWETLEGSTVLWRAISTDIDDGVPFTFTEEIISSLDFNVTLTFINLDWLNPSADHNYRFSGKVILRVLGVFANGSNVVLSERFITVQLQYIIQDVILLVPDKLLFTHVTGQTLPVGQDITVYHAQDAYLLVTGTNFVLTGAGTATQLGTSELYAYFIAAPAGGSTTVTLVPTIGIEDTEDELVTIPQGVYGILDGTNTFDDVDVSFFTFSVDQTIITPEQMLFTSIINVQEAGSQTISIFSPNSSTLVAPSWLTLSASSVTSIGTVEVTPIDALNLGVGTYVGQIVITNDGIDYTIDVQLQVFQNIQLNLNQDSFNFTDNNQAFTEIFTENNANQFQLGVTIPQIGYPSTFAQDESFNYLTGFINNRTKIHIGEIVRRTLYKITKADFTALFNQYLNTIFLPLLAFEYYEPSKVKLDLSVVNNVGVVQSTEETFNNITFVLGRPPIVIDGFAFLNAKPITQRVFKQSVAMINYLTASPVLFSFYKNNVLDFTSNQAFSGLKVRGYFTDFDNQNYGDVIKVAPSIIPLGGGALTEIAGMQQSFIVFPDGKHFNTIAYADEYGCVRLFDFSGDWSIQSEYNFIESSRYKDLVEFFKNETTTKVQGITINTGFIPKDNEYYIDLIIRSGMAWLTTNNTEKVVELVPQTKKLTNVDSDQELYAYDITFKINRTHDFQNYS